jgi:predicted RNA polymerase sigma factor
VQGTGLAHGRAGKLEGDLAGSHRLNAVRGHLLELAGERDAAVDAYLSAANRTTNVAERNYLLTQTATLRENT